MSLWTKIKSKFERRTEIQILDLTPYYWRLKCKVCGTVICTTKRKLPSGAILSAQNVTFSKLYTIKPKNGELIKCPKCINGTAFMSRETSLDKKKWAERFRM